MDYRYCAKIDASGYVVSVIVCDSVELANEIDAGYWLPVYDDNYCGIGWQWDGNKFTCPEDE